MRMLKCPKDQVHGILVERFFPGSGGVSVAEFGRIRYPDEYGRTAEGWSTKRFAEHPRVLSLWSVDSDRGTEKTCRDLIDPACIHKVVFADSAVVDGCSLDLIYVDGPAEPWVNLRFLMDVWRLRSSRYVVGVDDWCYQSKMAMIDKVLGIDHDRCLVAETVVYWPRCRGYDLSWLPENGRDGG